MGPRVAIELDFGHHIDWVTLFLALRGISQKPSTFSVLIYLFLDIISSSFK